MRRINVSLDTLDEAKFKSVTRWGSLQDVLDGLEEAKRAGLEIKINAVALKGTNDHELNKMVSWCGDNQFDLTVIETMPMGEIDFDRNDQFLPLTLVREELEKLDPRRNRLPHGRACSICNGPGNREKNWLHHPSKP